MTTTTTSTERAYRALLAHYGENVDTTVPILLTELMHLCDEYSIPFADHLEAAQQRYDAEAWPGGVIRFTSPVYLDVETGVFSTEAD